MITLWVSKPDGKELILRALEDGGEYDENMYMIDPEQTIEEMYIENNGDIYCSINSDVGIDFSFNIPFDDWFYQFNRFDCFDKLYDVLSKKEKECVEVKGFVKNIIEKIERSK